METSLGESIAKRPGSSGAVERGLRDVVQMSNHYKWRAESSGMQSICTCMARSECT